ncbi:MAG: hypothetical protein J5762_02780 [Clostridia bacterium]|nr:hypothetical protein [Clostridia bacterium]
MVKLSGSIKLLVVLLAVCFTLVVMIACNSQSNDDQKQSTAKSVDSSVGVSSVNGSDEHSSEQSFVQSSEQTSEQSTEQTSEVSSDETSEQSTEDSSTEQQSDSSTEEGEQSSEPTVNPPSNPIEDSTYLAH